MDGITGLLKNISIGDIGKFLGGDAFKNMVGLGSNLWQMNNQNKMLGLQQNAMQHTQAQNDKLLQRKFDKEDQMANVDWMAGYESPVWN